MNPEELPYVGAVFRFGAEDRILDSILLFGPIVILAMILVGRTPVTTAVTVLYLLVFVGYVIYNGLRRGPGNVEGPR